MEEEGGEGVSDNRSTVQCKYIKRLMISPLQYYERGERREERGGTMIIPAWPDHELAVIRSLSSGLITGGQPW